MSKAKKPPKGRGKAKTPSTSDARAGAHVREHRGSNQRKHPQPLPRPAPEVLSGEVQPVQMDQAMVQAILPAELKLPDFVPVDKVDPRQYKPNEKDRTMVALGRAALLTSDQIAGLVGVSRATLYKYYGEELHIGIHQLTTRVLSNVAVTATQTNDRKAAMSAAKLWLENIAGLNKAAPGGDKEAASRHVEATAGVLTPQGVLKVTLKIGDKKPINSNNPAAA